ncbi:MAG: hypothetical protein ACMVO3_07980 [Thalassobaculum sp.]
MILMGGGFEPELARADVASLEYWRVGGGTPPGKIDAVDALVPELVENARTGLEALIAAFDDKSDALPRRAGSAAQPPLQRLRPSGTNGRLVRRRRRRGLT